jgi:hypothetical protein
VRFPARSTLFPGFLGRFLFNLQGANAEASAPAGLAARSWLLPAAGNDCCSSSLSCVDSQRMIRLRFDLGNFGFD